MQSELFRVKEFLTDYQIRQINPETIVLNHHQNGSLLVKTFNTYDIDEESASERIELLEQHLSFDKQYVCPLLHYELAKNSRQQLFIRAIYQYSKITLRDEIYERAQRNQIFSEQDLWILISSIVNSLIYLQKQGVVYGVLSSDKIVIKDKIRLIDPSAFNLNPVTLSQLSLISPELKNQEQNIDLYQSDVYLLGLCLLEAASLKQVERDISTDEIAIRIEELSNCYSNQMIHLISYMLKQESQDRPSCQNIKQFIEKEINMRQSSIIICQPLDQDLEDEPNKQFQILNEAERQIIDILQIDDLSDVHRYEQNKGRHSRKTSKWTNQSDTVCDSYAINSFDKNEPFEIMDTIRIRNVVNIQNEKDKNLINENKSKSKDKKPNRAKQLKDKLIQKGKTLKTVQSIHLYDEQLFTNPNLIKQIKTQAQRYRAFRNKQNSCYNK